MRLNSIQLTNVRNHTDFQHTFTDGITAIIGGNGSGKSTILTGLCVGLWGARSLEPLVKSGEKDMRIELDFSIGDDTYHIVRGAHLRPSGPTSQLSLSKNGQDVSGSRIPDTQALIREVVGPYSVAASTYIVPQGETARFASMTPAERRDMINGVLKLNELWDGLYGGVSKHRASKDREYQRLNDIRDQKVIDLSQVPHDNELHSKKNEIQSSIKKAQEVLDVAEDKYLEAKVRLDNANDEKRRRTNVENKITFKQNEFNELRRKVAEQEKKLESYSNAEGKAAEHQEKRGALDEAVSKIDTELEGLRSRLTEGREVQKQHRAEAPVTVARATTFSWIGPIKDVLGKYEKVEDSISSGICGQCGSKIVDKSHIEQAKAELNGFYTNLVEQAEEVGFTFPALGESCEFVFMDIEAVLKRNQADNLQQGKGD